MKNLLIIVAILCFVNHLYAQIHVDANGDVGIGTLNPSRQLHVNGSSVFDNWTDIYLDWNAGTCCGVPVLYGERNWYFQLGTPQRFLGKMWIYDVDYHNLYQVSDKRAKDNIVQLDGVLDKLERINAYTYTYKAFKYEGLPEAEKTAMMQKKRIGFLAQELEQTFPEVVRQPESETEMMAVDYVSMVPVLTAAIKEQTTYIEALENTIVSQEKSIVALSERLAKLEEQLAATTTEKLSVPPSLETGKSVLMQNTPNPFTEDTKIQFILDDAVGTAKLVIYDMKGTEVRQFILEERGEGSIILDGSLLNPGLYLYTLMADGKVIDSKRMILTSDQ